ncbi:MAG: acyl-CoA dehydrogenase family protein [Pigmentiphaga sp.]|uniref:acyl-CoA dehydrogenase family protein n=1 Tax=Pigmentiphaga sp. TaxID=1977564 RepID=UPI0029B1761D|nr:acyl-CoA dehydrogenase family protein [Pigmentiphaga sp.]MDX3906602.1 acyl-CoA dehydrogenase family protein [Pigmentiphaga sp.]
MDYLIPEEFSQFAELTRQFVRQELWPHEEEVERADCVAPSLAARLRAKAVELGLFGFNMPEEAGGPGLPYLAQVLIREQLGQASVALADMVGRPPKALLVCQGEQRQRLLQPAVRGEKIWAFALTEPGAGSDAAAIRTRATREQGGWRLNGTKHFISHGNHADYVIVIAKASQADGDVPAAFVVERGAAGFSVGRIHRKMGWRGYPICELVFDGVFVGDDNVLGAIGDGLRLGLANILESRIGVAAHCVGMAQRAYDYAVEHLRVRRQFGRQLGSFQGLQWMVADMAVEIEQSRALLYAAAREMDRGGDARAAVSMAKLSATEMAGRVADRALQLLGGAGYMAESPIEMIYRDARAFRIGEGTSEIQKNQIARACLGREMFA